MRVARPCRTARPLAALCASGMLLVGSSGWTGDPDQRQICAAAYHAAQEHRLAGRLTAARRELLTCSQESCPTAVKKDCAKWLPQVNDSQPTIAVVVKGIDGQDVTDVAVFIDGELAARSLDGHALDIDPGPHTLRFEHRTAPPIERQIVVQEGVKNRLVEVSFETAPLDAEPVGEPIGAYVLGGVGVAALGVFVGLAVAGTNEVSELRDTCGQTSSCTDEQIDSARTKLIVGDVFLGVGAVALGVGVTWLLYHHLSEPDDAAEAVLHWGVQPTTGGGYGVVSWSF